MKNYVNGVKEACDFVVEKGDIEPRYTSLAQGVYVVEGYTNLYYETINASGPASCVFPREIPRCNPCLMTVNCGCNLKQRTQGSVSAIISNRCVGNSTANTVLHPVKLIVLQHFYNFTNVTMDGTSLFDTADKLNVDPLKSPLFWDNVKKLLAADDEVGYSLRKLANSMQNDTTVYHSSAEAMLADYITSHLPSKWMGMEITSQQTTATGGLLLMVMVSMALKIQNQRTIRQLKYNIVGMTVMSLMQQ